MVLCSGMLPEINKTKLEKRQKCIIYDCYDPQLSNSANLDIKESSLFDSPTILLSSRTFQIECESVYKKLDYLMESQYSRGEFGQKIVWNFHALI